MNKLIVFHTIVAVALLMFTAASYAAHPATGHPIDEHWIEGSSYPPAELSLGDLTFMADDEYPDFDKLTQLEQYMLFGVVSSDLESGGGLPSYVTSIIGWVAKFYQAEGYIPEQLTPEMNRLLPGRQNVPAEWLSIERNPLTGEWPLLQAAAHSPGDFYIRALTDAEIDYFVEHGYGYLRSPSGGAAERTTPVFYVRMYGYDGVLLNGFQFLATAK